jgi:ribosomal-protein-alanine N-acetyltransferase
MRYYNHKINFPVIDLGDYILREQTVEDAQDFFNYYSDPIVNKYIVSDIPADLEEARREISYWINVFNCNDGIYFGIARKDNNQLIGSAGLSGINHRHNRIELSYDLAKEYWNLGIMSKALKEVVKYGFEAMDINRIEAFSLQENIASRKVLTKCGFNLEGELKQHRRHNGIYMDIGIFSLVKEDYLQLK